MYLEKETIEYALAALEKKMDSVLDGLNELKDSIPKVYVSKEVYHTEMEDMERRIKELESTNSRALWGLLAGAGSLVFTLGKALLGL